MARHRRRRLRRPRAKSPASAFSSAAARPRAGHRPPAARVCTAGFIQIWRVNVDISVVCILLSRVALRRRVVRSVNWWFCGDGGGRSRRRRHRGRGGGPQGIAPESLPHRLFVSWSSCRCSVNPCCTSDHLGAWYVARSCAKHAASVLTTRATVDGRRDRLCSRLRNCSYWKNNGAYWH